MATVIIGARCLVGVVFLVSAVTKLRSRAAFAEFVASLRATGLVPARWARRVAVVVVLTEAAIPALLAVPVLIAVPAPLAAAGFALATGVLGVFTVGLALAVSRGVRTPCRCFGASVAPLGLPQIVRNALLTVTAAAGLVAVLADGSAGWGHTHPATVAMACAVGLVLAILAITFDDLVDLFRPAIRP